MDDDFHQHEWPSHQTCFHTTIEDWKQCIFTCPEEIEEYELASRNKN